MEKFMRITLPCGMAALFLTSSALAAPANTPTDTSVRAAQNNVAPAPGATLTEADAKARMAAQGFGSVSELLQDEKGLWHARAIKNGRRLNVIVDAEGKVQIGAGK
jgi:hypothetical protein